MILITNINNKYERIEMKIVSVTNMPSTNIYIYIYTVDYNYQIAAIRSV